MRGKVLLTTIALASLVAAVPALADDAKPLAGQSITVLMPSPQAATIPAEFEKATGIHVDLQTLSWDDIRPKLVTALIAGSAPADVTEFDWSWTGQFADAGWYLPLNNVIDADTVNDIGVAKIFTVNGNLLGVPYTNDFRVMLVNKKQFADAGITKMPTTLDELVADAKQIKAKGITQYPIGLPLSPTEGASTSWYLLTKAEGGDLFDKDWKPLFTSPDSAGYKAMALEKQLLDEGYKTLLLNLAGTNIVNSIGISILIEIIEKMIEIDGKLGFCCRTPTIEKTFHIMGLAQYAPIYSDEATAVAQMRS